MQVDRSNSLGDMSLADLPFPEDYFVHPPPRPEFMDMIRRGAVSDMDIAAAEPLQEVGVLIFSNMRRNEGLLRTIMAEANLNSQRKTKDKEKHRQKEVIPGSLNTGALAPCSFLEPGTSFSGTQNASQEQMSKQDVWCIQVTVEETNWSRGYLAGTMRAEGFVDSVEPILTFWEGEIVDNINYTFRTTKWKADSFIDNDHWAKFPSLQELSSSLQQDRQNASLRDHPYVYMRLKEKYFVSGEPDSNLTIAGFYYVCLSRETGNMVGYYYDPNSTPFQKIDLNVDFGGTAGYVTGACSML